jgi:hypothetical protein
MRWLRIKLVMAVIGIFVLGLLSGGVLVEVVNLRRARALLTEDPTAMRVRLMTKTLQTRLRLTKPQEVELARILAAQAEPFAEAAWTFETQRVRLRHELAEQLKPVLDDSQRTELDRVFEEFGGMTARWRRPAQKKP